MPRNFKTLDGTIADLRNLSSRVAENASTLPDVTAEKSELDKSLDLVEEALTRQSFHESEKLKATQDVKVALGRGKEAARQIRFAVKLRLGARNEQLANFNVAPLRTRAGRRAAVLNPPDDPKVEPTGPQTPPNPKATNP